jgi:Holliday junction resolvase RusA-like endonuclease
MAEFLDFRPNHVATKGEYVAKSAERGIMAVRSRTWTTANGELRQAWVTRYMDGEGRRRLKTFRTKGQATAFESAVNVAKGGAGQVDRGRSLISFTAPLPRSKKRDGRQAVVDALLETYPHVLPTACPVIVHVTAEAAPSAVVCDVDNLLKPVLDALAGHVYVNDTQVIECMARKIPSAKNRLQVKVWLVPTFQHLPDAS